MRSTVGIASALLAVTSGLQVEPSRVSGVSRRAAIAGLVGIPFASSAANPLATDSFTGYKTRDYGDGPSTAPGSVQKTSAPVCEEGQRLAPDGFGGKKCVGEVKSLSKKLIDGVTSSEDRPPPSPPPERPRAAPAKSVGESTRSSSSDQAKPLTFDELLQNSIQQKASVLGRDLSDAEKTDLAMKLKKLMS